MHVRECSADDLDAVRGAATADVADAHHAAQQAGRATFLIAWGGDLPLGWGVVAWNGCSGPNARRLHPDAVELAHLHVLPEHRRQGVATLLVAAAETWMRRRGRRNAAISVELENTEARRLYEALGYRPTGAIDACTYCWRDDDGAGHETTENNELLRKRLGGTE